MENKEQCEIDPKCSEKPAWLLVDKKEGTSYRRAGAMLKNGNPRGFAKSKGMICQCWKGDSEWWMA